MCTEYDSMQYCPIIGEYCYTPNECKYCSEYNEQFESEEEEIIKKVEGNLYEKK